MGYGTSFTVDIYLNRQIFSNRYELDEKVKELEKFIEMAKQELLALAVATPRDVIAEKNEDGYVENPLDQIIRRTRETFEWMEDNYRDLHKLYQFQEYLDENPDVEINQFKDF
jgi:intein-encoded DNA endonuclease-like protein